MRVPQSRKERLWCLRRWRSLERKQEKGRRTGIGIGIGTGTGTGTGTEARTGTGIGIGIGIGIGTGTGTGTEIGHWKGTEIEGKSETGKGKGKETERGRRWTGEPSGSGPETATETGVAILVVMGPGHPDTTVLLVTGGSMLVTLEGGGEQVLMTEGISRNSCLQLPTAFACSAMQCAPRPNFLYDRKFRRPTLTLFWVSNSFMCYRQMRMPLVTP